MMKATTAFMIIYFLNVIIGGVFEGGGGIAATRLSSSLSSTATTVNVISTEGFLSSDYIVIGGERIRYVGKTNTAFNVPSSNGRGYDATTATSHPVNANVYSEATDVINGMIGFNVASTSTTVGKVNIAMVLYNFTTISIPKLLTWNFPHLMVNPLLQYVRYLGVLVTAGYVIYVILYLAGAMGGLMNQLFNFFR